MAKLSVLIGADDRELQAALKRSRSSIKKFGKEARAMAGGAAAIGAAAVVAGAAIAAHLVKDALDAVDAQAKLAAQMNTTSASVATLKAVGELGGVSMQQMEMASKKLAVSLGEAAQGTGPAVESLKRLGLSADELAKMPLDQRIATINDAIRENIPLSQQAAVAADLFGARAGAAMLQLSGDAIREAAEDTKIFGLALSDVDAKKVEMANDAMTRVGMAMDGFVTQIAIQAAPVIKAVADKLVEAAKEAGGFGTIAANAFDKVVMAAGFVMDAIDGIRRVFSVVADGIIIGIAGVVTGITAQLSLLYKALDAVPGVNMTEAQASMQRFSEESALVMEEAMANIQATLDKPMPSEGLKRFVEEAKAAGQAAAEAAAVGQPTDGGSDDGLTDKERESAQKRLDALREKFMSEAELSKAHRDQELAQIAEFENQKLLDQIDAQLMREDAEWAHQQRIKKIKEEEAQKQIDLEKRKNDAIKQATGNFFSNLAGLMNTNSRKVFELGKAAAIGQAAYKGGLAVMDAWEAGMSVGGPWAPAVAAGYATAAGLNAANLINNIRKQQFGGGGGTPIAPTQGSSNISPVGAGGGSTAGGGGPTTIVNLKGDFFSREAVRNLIESFNEEGSDGGRFVTA